MPEFQFNSQEVFYYYYLHGGGRVCNGNIHLLEEFENLLMDINENFEHETINWWLNVGVFLDFWRNFDPWASKDQRPKGL